MTRIAHASNARIYDLVSWPDRRLLQSDIVGFDEAERVRKDTLASGQNSRVIRQRSRFSGAPSFDRAAPTMLVAFSQMSPNSLPPIMWQMAMLTHTRPDAWEEVRDDTVRTNGVNCCYRLRGSKSKGPFFVYIVDQDTCELLVSANEREQARTVYTGTEGEPKRVERMSQEYLDHLAAEAKRVAPFAALNVPPDGQTTLEQRFAASRDQIDQRKATAIGVLLDEARDTQNCFETRASEMLTVAAVVLDRELDPFGMGSL